MSDDQKMDANFFKKYSLALASVGILVVFVALVLFLNARSKDGGIVFPSGVNYLSPEDEAAQAAAADLADFDAWASGNWKEVSGVNYPFVYSVPEGLNPLYFPNDTTEKVAFAGNGRPAEQNILLQVEQVSNYNADSVGNLEQFAEEDYWTQFNGMVGAASGRVITTESGLEGYSVRYENASGDLSGEYVFIPIAEAGDRVVIIVNQFARDYKESIFDRIVNSVRVLTPAEVQERAKAAEAAAAAAAAGGEAMEADGVTPTEEEDTTQ